jgi:hypothetical protein
MSLTKASYSMVEGAPVNVRDWGAKGDGVTDDTAAIQAAIDYCVNLSIRKQTLYFPANEPAAYYKVTAPLVINGRLSVVGDGQFSTTILGVGFTAGQFLIDYSINPVGTVYFAEIKNIALGHVNPTVGNGVRLKDISYMVMKQVYIYNCYEAGLYITGTNCFSNSFEEVTIYNMGNKCVTFENFTGGGQYMFSACSFVLAANGFTIQPNAFTDALLLQNCNFEQNTISDLVVYGGVNGLNVIGCRSEGQNGNYSLNIQPTAPNIVRGFNLTGYTIATDYGNCTPVALGGTVEGFTITGNEFGYSSFIQAVELNGAGVAGVISGNAAIYAPRMVNANREGVYLFANKNGSGPFPDYFGVNNSFTATATGMTTSPTGSVKYSIVGNLVTLDIPIITGTSNNTTFTLTGAPSIVAPATEKDVLVRVVDNGTAVVGFARIKITGIIEFFASVSGTAFTNSGTKAVNTNSISYTLA